MASMMTSYHVTSVQSSGISLNSRLKFEIYLMIMFNIDQMHLLIDDMISVSVNDTQIDDLFVSFQEIQTRRKCRGESMEACRNEGSMHSMMQGDMVIFSTPDAW